MKNLICLLAAASMILTASAQENSPESPDGNAPQYSEKGYKRPGKSQNPKFTEKFLNSGETAIPESGETEDGEDTPAAPGTSDASGSGDKTAPDDTPYVPAAGQDRDNDLMDLVKQACRNGVFIIRQPYGIVDSNGDFYALEDGKLEVGATYSPGYYIRGGYLFTDEALSPWNHDTTFNDIVEPGMMGRLIDATSSALLFSGAEYDSIPFNAASRGNVYPGLLYSMRDNSAFASDGFYASSEPGDLDGFLIWLMKSPVQDLSADTDLMVTAVRKPITTSDDPARTYPLGKGATNAIGAIYVTPEITGVGRIDLYLQGVGIEKDGQWSLIFPFTDFSKVFDTEQAVKLPANEPEHKPVKLRKITVPKADTPEEPTPEI